MGIVVKIAAEENEAIKLVIAVSATVAAVMETEAIVMMGECALTVFVSGTEAQRRMEPCVSKSFITANASTAGREKSCFGRVVGRSVGAENVC